MLSYKQANQIVKFMNHFVKGLYVVGSFRRKEPIMKDLDFVTKKPLTYLLDEMRNEFDTNVDVLEQGDKYMMVEVSTQWGNIPMDFWRATSDYEYFFLKTMRTMDKGHNIYYRKQAQEKGYSLNDRGLLDGSNMVMVTTKKDLNRLLGIKQGRPYTRLRRLTV